MTESKTTTNGGLLIGWALGNVTPDGPVSLWGQYYDRISQYVQSPLMVTALALESVHAKGEKDQAIMVSMDFLYITKALQESLRTLIQPQIPDFDPRKLFLNATHTHSGPDPDAKQEYRDFLLKKTAETVVKAWKNRQPGGISRELGYAVVGHNRRVQFADGTTEMYGSTAREDFIGMEGPSNPGVDMLFTWNADKKLTGVVVNVSCPAQVTEAKYFVSSDYWSEVRKQVQKEFAEDVFVLPQCGAAGDLAPRDLPRGYKSGEPNMWDIPGMEEIGRRLIRTILDAYPHAKESITEETIFCHQIKEIALPTRRFTEAEYNEALEFIHRLYSNEPRDPGAPGYDPDMFLQEVRENNKIKGFGHWDNKNTKTAWNRFLQEIKENEKIKEFGPWDNKKSDFGVVRKKERLVEHYLKQNEIPPFQMELHILRLGDVVFVTNPFELFTDFGFQIMGRSKAKQTFIVQLSCDSCGYLATQRAIDGGGYSALVNYVGPEGGRMLVNETVKAIDELWESF